MARFTFDARINTTITVEADDEVEAEGLAEIILERLTLVDAETEEEYSADTEDGLELIEED